MARALLAPFVALLFALPGAACGAKDEPPAAVPIAPVAVAAPADASAPASDSASFDAQAWLPVQPDDPQIGSSTALVTIVELGDFQCPFTQRAQLTMSQLEDAYGPDKLRIVWKNDPLTFHKNAYPAAEAAVGVRAIAGNDAFWRFHDIAFRNQSELSIEVLPQWAERAGVTNVAELKSGLAAHTWAKNIDRDMALAKESQAVGTPAFFVDGVYLGGAQSLATFKTAIDAELVKARAALDARTPREQLYSVLSLANKREHPVAAKEEAAEAKDDRAAVHKVPVDGAPVRGNADALVTLVEFGDFECPYTRQAEAMVTKLRDTYGDKIRVVWRHEPQTFHAHAEPAAEIAALARAQKGMAGFWKVHDDLLAGGTLTDGDLVALATKDGISAAHAASAIGTHARKRQIDRDRMVALDFGATGTPTFFVNGRRVVGAVSFDTMKPIVDEEVKRAEAMLASLPSASRGKLYDALIKDGEAPETLVQKTVAANPKAPYRGPKSAKVVIQEFADFQCVFCARAQSTLTALQKTYGSRLEIVWRNHPLAFHADAELAAEVAMEAQAQKGNDGFWKMHDALFAAQKDTDGLKLPALEKIAAAQGLDMARLRAALDAHTHRAAIAADTKAADDAGLSGTPAFVVNGTLVNGAQEDVYFERVIEHALGNGK